MAATTKPQMQPEEASAAAKRERQPSVLMRLLRGARARRSSKSGVVLTDVAPQPSPPFPTSPARATAIIADPRQGGSLTQTPARRFILAIDEHSAFLWACAANGLFDRYTFAAAFSLCWRFACSGASLDEAFSSSTLFFALHLFWGL